jgi:CRISPR/Cas system-associated protein Csm6
MQKTIITTVGTSLITNYLDNTRKNGNTDQSCQEAYDNLKEYSFFEHNLSERDIERRVFSNVKTVREKLGNFSSCAEVSSIVAIEKELQITDRKLLTIHLICTDTILSPLCAEVIAKYLTTQGYDVNFHEQENIISEIKNPNFNSSYIIKDLRVDDKEKFEKKGLITLIKEFYSIIEQNNYEFNVLTNTYVPSCILNTTGGYKGLIPYLTVFSQISKVKTFYLFEDTNKVIEIPQISISLDWNFIAQNSSFFNDLADVQILEATEDWQSYKQQYNIPDTFDKYYHISTESDGTKLLGLNAIGTILHKELGKYFFIEIPINSRYFKDEVSIKREVNKAIKDLFYKLSNLSLPFETLIDPILRHCNIDDTSVYKDTSSHVRVQYKYIQKAKKLAVINYYYKREVGNEYKEILQQEYFSIYKGAELTILPFDKIL